MSEAMEFRQKLDSLEVYDGQQEREARVVFALFGMVSELILDLDMTAARARELFTLSLFERAQQRYGSNTRVSLAFDSALRTVKKIKARLRKNGLEADAGHAYNLRRKVYLLLWEKERTLNELAAELPINFEVNYARLAVETLRAEGMVEAVEHRALLYRRRRHRRGVPRMTTAPSRQWCRFAATTAGGCTCFSTRWKPSRNQSSWQSTVRASVSG